MMIIIKFGKRHFWKGKQLGHLMLTFKNTSLNINLISLAKIVGEYLICSSIFKHFYSHGLNLTKYVKGSTTNTQQNYLCTCKI